MLIAGGSHQKIRRKPNDERVIKNFLSEPRRSDFSVKVGEEKRCGVRKIILVRGRVCKTVKGENHTTKVGDSPLGREHGANHVVVRNESPIGRCSVTVVG